MIKRHVSRPVFVAPSTVQLGSSDNFCRCDSCCPATGCGFSEKTVREKDFVFFPDTLAISGLLKWELIILKRYYCLTIIDYEMVYLSPYHSNLEQMTGGSRQWWNPEGGGVLFENMKLVGSCWVNDNDSCFVYNGFDNFSGHSVCSKRNHKSPAHRGGNGWIYFWFAIGGWFLLFLSFRFCCFFSRFLV